MDFKDSANLSRKLRNGSLSVNRNLLVELGLWSSDQALAASPHPSMEALCELMVENPVGAIQVPLGIAPGLLVDGVQVNLPMATEEPSVVAAATFAARLTAAHGGVRTETGENRVRCHVYVEFADPAALETGIAALSAGESHLRATVLPLLQRMEARGGGLREIRFLRVEGRNTAKIEVEIAVCDAHGANLANTCAESLRKPAEKLSGGRVLMCILSNEAGERLTRASFALPAAALRRAGFSGEEAALRIVSAAELAAADPDRCVTHNKGVMNGVTALALATANDTRAIEAACHTWACRSGRVQPLTVYKFDGEYLRASFEAPLPFATVGGATSVHQGARAALSLLPETSATALARYAAALGLVQNLAALAALTAEGIQSGHMRLHAARLAWEAGARGDELARVRERLSSSGQITAAAASEELSKLRGGI